MTRKFEQKFELFILWCRFLIKDIQIGWLNYRVARKETRELWNNKNKY
jgi:hypothetical protein